MRVLLPYCLRAAHEKGENADFSLQPRVLNVGIMAKLTSNAVIKIVPRCHWILFLPFALLFGIVYFGHI